MAYQQILSVAGPLPIKSTFNLSIDGPVDFIVTSTAWTTAPNVPIGIQVAINGQPLGSSTLYANPPAQHMTLPTIVGTVTIQDPTATQTITIIPSNIFTITDGNDNFVVWAHY